MAFPGLLIDALNTTRYAVHDRIYYYKGTSCHSSLAKYLYSLFCKAYQLVIIQNEGSMLRLHIRNISKGMRI